MAQSPSNRRREGKNAFIPYEDPERLCRYRDEGKREDWLDGWNIAKAAHEEEEAEAEETNREFDMLADSCPWKGGVEEGFGCEATGWDCSSERCAIWHFKQGVTP